MSLLLIQALYSMKLVIKLRDFIISTITDDNIKDMLKDDMISGLSQVFLVVLGLYQWLSSKYLTLITEE